jgi:hypothetical protein
MNYFFIIIIIIIIICNICKFIDIFNQQNVSIEDTLFLVLH